MMTAATPLDLLAVGESMIVLVATDGKPLEFAATFAAYGAGAESNVASYLAQRGHRVGWAGALGADPFGRRLLAEFRAGGIDVADAVVAAGERTGVYFKDPGQSQTVHYYRAGSAASRATVDELAGGVDRTARLHVSGITAAIAPDAPSTLRALVARAKAAGVLVSFDVNHRPSLWTRDVAGPVLADLARMADVVFVGRDEAELLWGTATADDVRALLPAAPQLVVKDSSIGATAFAGDECTFVPAPIVKVVEVVGAGDAFAAGYLSGLIDNEPIERRLRLGHLLAAHVLRSHADNVRIPDRATLAPIVEGRIGDWAPATV